MKKAFLVLLAAILVLCSCAETEKTFEGITLPIKISAAIKGTDGIFNVCITESGAIITFDESHALNGTRLEFNEDGGIATIGSFSREVSPEIFPAQNSLIKALRGINGRTEWDGKTEDGFKYTIDEMTIMVYYDEDTERVTNIRTEENGRHFDFVVVALEPYEEQSNGAGSD